MAALHAAQPAGRPPELAQVGKPTPEEAAQLVKQVRQAGIPGEFYLAFELRALPRRGAGKTFQGQLWSGRNEQGIITRVEVVDASGHTQRLLIQRGDASAVWRLQEGRAVAVEGSAVVAPLVPGVEVSAFDLQMPFLHWPDVTVEKLTRVMGRPAWVFLFRPPQEFAARHREISGVRAYLDTQFNAIMQTEILGANHRPTKTFSLVNLKRVGEQYLPKEADFRNEGTRDKTRLQVTGAALNLSLPREIFTPEGLARHAPPPPAGQFVSFDR